MHFTAFLQFVLVLNESQPCYTQAHYLDLHKQKVKLATWGMMFSVIQKIKKEKRKKKTTTFNVCETNFCFSSFILTNDITVQLLACVEGGRGCSTWPGDSLRLNFHHIKLKKKRTNRQVKIFNNMVPLHKVLLPFL